MNIHYPFFCLDTKESARMAKVSVMAFSFLLTTGMLRKISNAVSYRSDLEIFSFRQCKCSVFLVQHCIIFSGNTVLFKSIW